MVATAPNPDHEQRKSELPTAEVYTAREVAAILRLAPQTVYALAKEKPGELGVVPSLSRAVRFRRGVIDRLARGDCQ